MKVWLLLKRFISAQYIILGLITFINIYIFSRNFSTTFRQAKDLHLKKIVHVNLGEGILLNGAADVEQSNSSIEANNDQHQNKSANGATESVLVHSNTLQEYILKNGAEPYDKFLHVDTRRVNMGKCNHVYGKIMVFVAVEEVAFRSQYKVALDSLRCYIASTDYDLKIIDVFKDERSKQKCSEYKTVYFRKHCAARYYLEDADWMFVMDADSGIVNPNHCIEEYIDDRVDMVFYERFFNWEIACGNYLAKNTNFSKDFLMRWADYEKLELGGSWWKGFDNGAMHITVLESVFPKDSEEVKSCRNIWFTSTGYETYMPYVFCVRYYLGGTRLWPRKFKLLRRAHAFCRDWYFSDDSWCENDFLIHGWKAQHVKEKGWMSPFLHDFDLSKCGPNENGWPWRPEKRKTCMELKGSVAQAEQYYAKDFPKKYLVIPFLNQSDVGNCYPNCDIRERIHGH